MSPADTAAAIDSIDIIDSDTHVIEPYDLWTSRLSTEKWGNLIPHVRFDEDSREEVWYFGDKKIYAAGLASGASWTEFPPDHPKKLADSPIRNYDPVKRLEHMDEYGVKTQVLYPNIGVFQVNEYIGMKADPALVLECVRAYNDFLLDWCAVAPDRYVPLMTVPFWDMDAAIKELHRSHDTGHKGVVFPARMEDFNLPALTETHWDRFWAECQEMDLSVNFHIGSGNIPMYGTNNAGKHLSYAWTGSLIFFLNASAIVSLILGGICQRFPRLNFVSVESGVGWLPFLLESMDWQFHNTGVVHEHPEFELLPSEYFARQIYACFWFERGAARAAIEELGADHIMFETDFPHPTGMTPGPASAASAPRDHLKQVLAGLPEADIRKILRDNAARLYHL
jgi:predicted TIM-barrel fold metal-dependent hydrolase